MDVVWATWLLCCDGSHNSIGFVTTKPSSSLWRLDWATLYQRVFDLDPLECPSCDGRMRFVEVIEAVGRARSELRRRNMPAQPPPRARARSPDSD
jgi:hypothetical protein